MLTSKLIGSAAVVGMGLSLAGTPASAQAEQGQAAGQQQQAQQAAGQQGSGQQGQLKGYATSVEELTKDWPEDSKKAATKMQEQYGQPTGMTPNRIVWQNKGPWKEIIVTKDPIQHDFPMPHKDVLEQVINYEVPPDKFDDLAEFDGSVIAERTKGTLSARCDKEAANFLALNLADEIVKGKKSVEEARQAYAENIKQMLSGQKPQIMQKLQFDPPQQAGDTDVAVMQKPQGQQGEAQPAGEQQQPQGQQSQQQ